MYIAGIDPSGDRHSSAYYELGFKDKSEKKNNVYHDYATCTKRLGTGPGNETGGKMYMHYYLCLHYYANKSDT